MNWTEQIDAYCERLGPGFWAEPLNAVTNLAFILAAIIMWRRSGGLTGARVLCGILFAIGVGSGLFHTVATGWAALADTAPIGVFILVYLFLTNWRLLGWPLWAALLGTAAFAPYAAMLLPVLEAVPFLNISDFYWTVPLLLVLYAFGPLRGRPETARGFLIGAGLLAASITIRSLDMLWCGWLPVGTHFLWHTLNAVMLAWMIEVYRRHMLAGAGAGR